MKWIHRTVAVAATTALVVGAAAPAASANGQHDTLYGDLNGDGFTDRAELVEDLPTPDDCGVIVELGDSMDGYGPPVLYSYPKPGGGAGYCPDMGVVVDLGGDDVVELVLAWFAGRPPSVPYDLLVLRDFSPYTGFQALFQPSGIGLADFNGDGLDDVYQWTDQGPGFVTFLNTPSGTLEPGPVQFCSGMPDYRLTDFNQNGAMDVVIAYAYGCSGPFSGVVVVLDDGSQIHLQESEWGDDTWSLDVLDADGDGIPDVKTVNHFTDEVVHFLNEGEGQFSPAPTARDDVVRVPRGALLAHVLDVLDNDAATSQASITIVSPPTYGYVLVTPEHGVIYLRSAGHRATDHFVYQLTDDGRTDTASVTVWVGR